MDRSKPVAGLSKIASGAVLMTGSSDFAVVFGVLGVLDPALADSSWRRSCTPIRRRVVPIEPSSWGSEDSSLVRLLDDRVIREREHAARSVVPSNASVEEAGGPFRFEMFCSLVCILLLDEDLFDTWAG